MIKAIRFIGYRNSGKTYAIERICKKLTEKNMSIVVVKSLGEHDLNVPGKDTYRFMQLTGNVIAVGQYSIAFIRRMNEKNLPMIINFIPYYVDIVLVEGFKEDKSTPKIICAKTLSEVERLRDGLEIAVTGPIALIEEKRKYIETKMKLPVYDVNVESELNRLIELILKKSFILPGYNCGKCGLNCYELAKKIVKGIMNINTCFYRRTKKAKVKLIIGGTRIELNPFIEEIIRSTVKGLLKPLKGYREDRIYLEIY